MAGGEATGGGGMSSSIGPWDEEPTAKPVDKEAERRELEAARWRS